MPPIIRKGRKNAPSPATRKSHRSRCSHGKTRGTSPGVGKVMIRPRCHRLNAKSVFSSDVFKELLEGRCIKDSHAIIPVFAYSHIHAQRLVEVKVPLQMDSPQMLVMAGFRPPAAELICQLRRPDQTMLEAVECFIDKRHENHYLGWTIKGTHDAPSKRTAQCAQSQHSVHKWRTTLLNLFLEECMVKKMLDPRYDEIRQTQCSCYWVLDNVKQCIEFCETVSQRVAHKEQRGDFEDRIRGTSEMYNSKLIEQSAALGRTVYYKGGPISVLEHCANYDGTITLDPLLEVGQFHASHPGVYLDTDPRLATLRADYIHRRLDFIDTAVLQVAMSESEVMAAANRIQPKDMAKLIVHSNPHVSRHDKVSLKHEVESLGSIEKSDMIMGPISADPDHAFKTLDVRGYQGRFLQCRDTKLGTPTQQLAIMSEDARETVERDLCSAFVWLSSISATGCQGARWDEPVRHY